MAYNYAQKDSSIPFDDGLVQGLMTASLETPNVDWLNAKSFRVKGVTTSGLQPHTRNKGFNYGTVQQKESIFTLEFDRDVEFWVDSMDVDETNQELTVANISGNFIRDQVIPETDAYRFSKLVQYAAKDSNSTTESVTSANVLEVVGRLTRTVRRYGPGSTTIYVSSAFMDALEQSKDFTRVIVMNNVPGTNIETRITGFNGFSFVEVWDDSRFMSAFDFTDGFKPVTSVSQAINALAVVRPAIVAKVKHNAIYLHSPGSVGQGDGWLYQYRLYHDLFQLPNRPNTVVASLAPVSP